MTNQSDILDLYRRLHAISRRQREINAVLPELIHEAFSMGLKWEQITEVTGIKKTRLYILRNIGATRPTVVNVDRQAPIPDEPITIASLAEDREFEDREAWLATLATYRETFAAELRDQTAL